MPADKSIETITLNEAIELFKLPREVGEYEGTPVTIGAGRLGPYVLHNKKYVSIPKDEDPMNLTLERAIELIREKRESEQKRHIKVFDEDTKLELLNGRYGPYIAYDGKNYRIPKNKQTHVEELSYEECMRTSSRGPSFQSKPKGSLAKSIIIIGYMGAGKTTVGKALAKELGVMFYDLDWYIETRMHKTVKEIFDEKGEEGFRIIEHNMLHEVAEFENVVVL